MARKFQNPVAVLASRLNSMGAPAVPSRLLESRHGGQDKSTARNDRITLAKAKAPRAAQELLCFGLKLKPGGLSRPELESQGPWLDVHCERGDGFDHRGHV
ncbi:hypothetical protein MJO29_005284 [Puccinia striiformis f. sp. tritici]|nr:hypothetical protein MJO29_005284 [Puccinia striiformis f. sp. tritici]